MFKLITDIKTGRSDILDFKFLAGDFCFVHFVIENIWWLVKLHRMVNVCHLRSFERSAWVKTDLIRPSLLCVYLSFSEKEIFISSEAKLILLLRNVFQGTHNCPHNYATSLIETKPSSRCFICKYIIGFMSHGDDGSVFRWSEIKDDFLRFRQVSPCKRKLDFIFTREVNIVRRLKFLVTDFVTKQVPVGIASFANALWESNLKWRKLSFPTGAYVHISRFLALD